MFGLAPMMLVQGNDMPEKEEEELDPDEKVDVETEEEEDNLTDETDLLDFEDESKLDEILDRDDVDITKYLDLVKTVGKLPKEEQKILFKDIKISVKKDEPIQDEKAEKSVPETKLTETKAPPKTEEKSVEKPADKLKPFVISEEFIKTQIDRFKEQNKENPNLGKMTSDYEQILSGVKGDTMSERAFKNYVNSQQYIKSIKTPFDPSWKPDPKVVSEPSYIEKATKQKNEMILNTIKSKYKDFPDEALTDPEFRKEFERDLARDDPREFRKYETLIDETEKSINDRYDRWFYITQNWETMAKDTVESDVKIFNDWLNSKGIKPEEIGMPDLTLDEKYYNQFLYDNVLYDEKKKPNETVMTFMDGQYPIIKPMAVFNTLKDIFIDQIIQRREEIARIEGFKHGKDNVIEPSLSVAPGMGNRDSIEIDESILDQDDPEIKQLDSFLDKVKNSIRGKRKK